MTPADKVITNKLMKNQLYGVMNVGYLTAQRAGKARQQIAEMLMRFDPEIHSKIKIEIHSSSEIKKLDKQLSIAMEYMEHSGSLISGTEKCEDHDDGCGKCEIYKIDGII